MKIFITGHTGFKGTWFSYLMSQLGHEITGYSDTIKKNSLFELSNAIKLFKSHVIGDVRDIKFLVNSLESSKSEVVIHFAAQPLVLKSFENQFETYETNVLGTLNILQAVDMSKFCNKIIIVTSDKVYSHSTKNHVFAENDRLGGGDPYSNSKAIADLLSQSWIFKNENKKVAIVRAGNVIGPGDISENRILPDIVDSIINKSELQVRNPDSIRPWQYVIDCVYGYYKLLQSFDKISNNSSWNFGPLEHESITVLQIVKLFQEQFPNLKVRFNSDQIKTLELKNLQINSNKSREFLNWSPKYTILETVKEISMWYKQYLNGAEPDILTRNTIANYLNKK